MRLAKLVGEFDPGEQTTVALDGVIAEIDQQKRTADRNDTAPAALQNVPHSRHGSK